MINGIAMKQINTMCLLNAEKMHVYLKYETKIETIIRISRFYIIF